MNEKHDKRAGLSTEDERHFNESIRYALLNSHGPEDSPEFEKKLRDSDPAFRPPPVPRKLEQGLSRGMKRSKRETHSAENRIRASRHVFMVVVAVVLFTALCCTVVAQFPELFSFLRFHGDHVEFGVVDDLDWSGLYKPSYIPEGYVCEGGNDFDRRVDLTRVVLHNSEGDMLLFAQYAPWTTVDSDSEGAEICELVDIFGEKDALYVRKDGENKLFWGSYHKFQLRGVVSLDELIKIAQSIDFVP